MTQVSNQSQKMETGSMSELPASLQYFAGLDEIIIKQKMEVLEALTGFETRNRYAVLNKDGQQIFFIQEESDTCERVCCPVGRGFTLHVTDNNVHEIMQFTREFKCCVGCCCFAGGCCQMVIAVDSPVGRRLGYTKTDTAPCKAHMKIYDAYDKHMFTVWGSMCPCQCCGCTKDVDYPVDNGPVVENPRGKYCETVARMLCGSVWGSVRFVVT